MICMLGWKVRIDKRIYGKAERLARIKMKKERSGVKNGKAFISGNVAVEVWKCHENVAVLFLSQVINQDLRY